MQTGVKLSQNYGMNHDYEMMKFEYDLHTETRSNQSTSQDDIFMKPNPSKVMNMKNGSYDKLNDKGYVPGETMSVTNDVIFGKVTPISNGSGKPYRDSSELYKMSSSGVVDRAYINIQNQYGYLTRKASIRSDRVPRIGDIYCGRRTADTEVLATIGWKKIKNVTLEDKLAALKNEQLEKMKNLYKTSINKN